MSVSTTEITSASLASDNPIHQRLLFAYEKACDYVNGDLLEIGCGQGRGLELLLSKCRTYTAIDRNELVISSLKEKFPELTLITGSVPPFTGVESSRYDSLVSLQVIEHIEDDKMFVDEIYRVLKPGGTGIISTPNIKMSLTRNPWHVREYTKDELLSLIRRKFREVNLMGVYGDEKVNRYYERNKESVRKITRWDIFNLQYRLPRTLLQVPYDILNRINRNKLKENSNGLATEITTADFSLKPADDACFDFFCVMRK
ncbi:MAG TPA: class I SAM-dependent methyltransferase [Chitinophagales bacterium]|nr:class I SAM-dependent methyltransferase [Chitinophagales bacterium]